MTKRARSATGERAAEREEPWRAVVDSMRDVVYTLDLEGRITYLNPRAYEVFGYDPVTESFIGREIMDIVAAGDTAPAMGAIRRRAETPRDGQVFRGRVGVCRVIEAAALPGGMTAHDARANTLPEERMRIARGLRDAIAQIVFGVTADRDASEAFLVAAIKDRVRRLMERLGARRRAELAAHTLRLGVA